MTFTGTLLPYQKPAFDLMVERGQVLVAYSMGLGKTPLTIAAVEELMERGDIAEPGIVLCLSSLKFQWADEVAKFSDSKALVIDGTPKQRLAQYEQVLDWRSTGVDYVVMTYDTMVNDLTHVQRLPRGFLVADECTAVKSFRSKRSKVLKKLAQPVDVRFGLTGTPMENGKPEEVFSIMEFVDPGVLGRFDLFDRTFLVRNQMGWVERYRNLDTLHRTLSSATVRKRQDDPDVAPHLPREIKPEPIRVPMDRATRKVYEHIREELLVDLEEAATLFGGSFDVTAHYGRGGSDFGGPADQLRGSLMSKMTCLRMLCQHPELVRHSARLFDGDTGQGSEYASHLVRGGHMDGVSKHPKLDAAVAYVKDQLEVNPDTKVVVFSTFLGVLPALAGALSPLGQSVQFHGGMNAKEKDAAKKQFQTDPAIRFFLSSDAGGYGVDLPQANVLVNFDLPWSSGTALQRNARIRRASSAWEHVVVQDVIVAGSIEERQHQMLAHKSAVAGAVLDGDGINDRGGIDMSVGSLREFLAGGS